MFRTPLITKHTDKYSHGRRYNVLTVDLVYELESGDRITIPQGFETDFASVPYVFRWLFPAYGTHAEAAVLHDWLYRKSVNGNRKWADQLFLEAMNKLGVWTIRRYPMYWAVRCFGWLAFHSRH